MRIFGGAMALLAFIALMPALLLASPVDSCDESLKRAGDIYSIDPAERREWLAENLLFGPEITILSDIFEWIPLSATRGKARKRLALDESGFVNDFPVVFENLSVEKNILLRREFWRLSVQVLGAEEVEFRTGHRFHYFDPAVGRVHPHIDQGAGYFVLKWKDGRIATLNLEDRHVELNLPPSNIKNLEKRFRPIMSAIFAAGFYGYAGFASGSGGGHIHLGFPRREDNLFLKDSRLLANLTLAPVLYPGWVYFLRDLADFGLNSNSRHPSDLEFGRFSTDVNSQRLEIRRLASILLGERSFLASENPVLGQHDRYVSLKNFFRDRKNPTLEFRFGRGFNSYEDLAAQVHLLFGLVSRFWDDPAILAHQFNLQDIDLLSWSDGFVHPLRQYRRELNAVMELADLSPEHRDQLYAFGGDVIDEGSTVYGSGEIGLRVFERPDLGYPLNRELYEFRIDLDRYPQARSWVSAQGNGLDLPLNTDANEMSLNLSFDYAAPGVKLISFKNERGDYAAHFLLRSSINPKTGYRGFRIIKQDLAVELSKPGVVEDMSIRLKNYIQVTADLRPQVEAVVSDSAVAAAILARFSRYHPHEMDFSFGVLGERGSVFVDRLSRLWRTAELGQDAKAKAKAFRNYGESVLRIRLEDATRIQDLQMTVRIRMSQREHIELKLDTELGIVTEITSYIR